MNKATLRPLARRSRVTAQQKKDAAARRAALPSKSYLRGVEGCTYRPLTVTTNAAANRNRTETTLTWRDSYNASK
jgi:hypothetical protein